ncbi:Phosphate propanoyltransferase [uncultured archaeon]|nr:Phosphate propanoyltransferase [uncultured archaeon]
MKIPIEISARHMHLSKEDFEKLFGKNQTLNSIKNLSQPGEFASDKVVEIINKSKKIEDVRILGPFRKNSQVEISMTDAYNLKLSPFPQIKVSGDVANTANILVRNKNNSIKAPCIIARRHLHASAKEAKKLKLKNNQNISIKIGGIREVTFHNIIVRVSEDFKLALHLDTDEGNAAGIAGKTFGELARKG